MCKCLCQCSYGVRIKFDSDQCRNFVEAAAMTTAAADHSERLVRMCLGSRARNAISSAE